MRHSSFGFNREKPLGLENFYILNSQLLSEYHVDFDDSILGIRFGCGTHFGTSRGYFLASHSHLSNFWQFDLGTRYAITYVMVQGSCSGTKFINKFSVQYSDDLVTWHDDKDDSGNIRSYTAMRVSGIWKVPFQNHIRARLLRFKRVAFSHSPTISMELYGFPVEYYILNKTASLPKTIEASSFSNNNHLPDLAFGSVATFWCKASQDFNTWWSINFGLIYYVERISIYYKNNLTNEACDDVTIYGAQYNKTNITDKSEVSLTNSY